MSRITVNSVTGTSVLGDGNIIINNIGESKRGNGNIETSVHRIHFEDRSGLEFERLCLAYLIRAEKYKSIDWLGQSGDDGGRDIWIEYESGETSCYQCANYRKFEFDKVKKDIDKLIANKTVPLKFVLVAGAAVNSNARNKIKDYAANRGITHVEIWSGVEFEERLRRDTPDLIKRFVLGEPFPENATTTSRSDVEIVRILAESFDRPAFTTGFRDEVSIPDFAKAISDTIEILNTGVHRLRDGTIVRRILSRHSLKDERIKLAFSRITDKLIDLRTSLNGFISSKDVKHCECGDPDCPVYLMSDIACSSLDAQREYIFSILREAVPEIRLRVR